ncbi:WecB/TagA/CpsF family glycosyltransferase [Gloeothece citriformis]|uniref:WecB/TagA/CpsF family glycosyltransferase n=1 Tax=Gloeothece citriformis TaxID=2546356 RepID=UPI0002EFE7A0|nr:WecB/TagA/CpsF family glycosyltransferase [Gloeothece citriformis]
MGAVTQERITDLEIFKLLYQSMGGEIKLFLLTEIDDVLTPLEQNLIQCFPNLKIVGSQVLSESVNEDWLDEINQTGANLVGLYLRNPTEEVIWLAEHKNKISAVVIGLGTFFQIYSEKYTELPPYVQEMGVEGLHRIMEHPDECWEIYSKNIPDFIWQILTDRGALERRILKLFSKKY